MQRIEKKLIRTRFLLWISLIIISIAVMAFLGVTVARDLRLMHSSTSDNVQWALSQAEVEFIEYEIHLLRATQEAEPDLRSIRQRYDIFYSRIKTLKESGLYASLRREEQFAENLGVIADFLAESVNTIDSDDPVFYASLPALLRGAQETRSNVRMLSNSALNYFAEESDRRRRNVAVTLTQMAAVVSFLLIALIFLAIFLNRLNTQNIRRRAEAIAASKRMKTVTSTALDAVVLSDIDGRILDFNAAAEQIFGHSAQEAIGAQLSDLIVPAHHRGAHEAGMQRLRDKGEKRVVGKGRIRLEAKRANGEVFPVEFAIQDAETDLGTIFIAFLRDISPQVEAEKALIEARDRALDGEKAKTNFLATMSHEIRTPLNGMLGNLSLLRETSLSAKQQRYIQNMDTSGRLLMSHISDVLDITKYDAGKLRLRPIEMNVSALLQDIIDNQSGAASANNTTLEWGWKGLPTDWIRADGDKLQHILMNIIGNAVKFTKNGGVWVEAEVKRQPISGPSLHITVIDTGIGIETAQINTIFDDFTTGNSAYDRDVGGTGLGLSIAQRFAKALGGTITVKSSKGEGSTFTISIPIEPIANAKAAPKQNMGMAEGPSRRILLVEDNEINRVVASEMLISAGHTVTEAHNGRDAVTLAGENSYDVILMDISMPVLDGRGATREIRAGGGISAQAPIIALTANAMAEEQAAYRQDGMNDILTKPLTREGLLRAVSHLPDTAASAPVEDSICSVSVSPRHIAELRESLGETVLKSMLEQFSREVDATLRDLQHFSALGFEETAARAHKIAGSAAIFGAVSLRTALIQLENAAKRQDADAVSTTTKALPDIWAETRSFMQAQGRKPR